MYQIYPRSFADGNGDGDGDLAGIREHLGYLADLGVDGIWLSPWYPSPMADGGYDVSDFTDIHPMFGTLAEADALVQEAHELGLRVIVDVVPNHTSSEHAWFRAALAAPPGSPERARYIFRDGRGDGGDIEPNNWISCFGGSAWERVPTADGSPGQYYLHLFAPEQPDLNWTNEQVLSDFDDILRFWFDRGVDGLRVDAAPALAKAPDLPDFDYGPEARFVTVEWVDNPHWDTDEVHEIFRRWRRIADQYRDEHGGDERVFVAEAVVGTSARLSNYLRPDEMHTAFNFPYLKSPWDAAEIAQIIQETLETYALVDAPATWVLSSHDETRLVSRYGRKTTGARYLTDGFGESVDLELGTRRSKAAALLMLALPGTAYIYQGEELGLPQVDDLPTEVLQDPVFKRTGGEVRGRDGCRVPIPWIGDEPPYGFSPTGVSTWLPQPEGWGRFTVQAQQTTADSIFSVYRSALRFRRHATFLHGNAFRWLDAPAGALRFRRTEQFECLVNISAEPITLDQGSEIILASAALNDGVVPRDTAVWTRPAQ